MIKPSASLQLLLSFCLGFFVLELKSQSIPSNIESGFLPPFTETIAQTFFFSVDPNATGSFILERAGLGFTSPLDIPITFNNGRFEVDVPVGCGAFRLKSTSTPPPACTFNSQNSAFYQFSLQLSSSRRLGPNPSSAGPANQNLAGRPIEAHR